MKFPLPRTLLTTQSLFAEPFCILGGPLERLPSPWSRGHLHEKGGVSFLLGLGLWVALGAHHILCGMRVISIVLGSPLAWKIREKRGCSVCIHVVIPIKVITPCVKVEERDEERKPHVFALIRSSALITSDSLYMVWESNFKITTNFFLNIFIGV